MNELLSSFDENELSPEDLAVLRAFEAMDRWDNHTAPLPPVASASVATSAPGTKTDTVRVLSSPAEDNVDDTLLLFIAEVEEDIATMRRALYQLEHDDHINHSGFVILQRLGHKIRGTAGAVEFHLVASIAHVIEMIVEQTTRGLIFPTIGVDLARRAVATLEETLDGIVTHGKETEIPLRKLEEEYKQFGIDPYQDTPPVNEHDGAGSREINAEFDDETMPDLVAFRHAALPSVAVLSGMSVNKRRFEGLLHRAERLTEMHNPLERAQEQVSIALQELQAAQSRLQKLEPFLASLLAHARPMLYMNKVSTSSLIARILNEGTQRSEVSTTRHIRPRSRPVKAGGTTTWDDLDMERFAEKDLLVRSMSEAIADVTIASTHVRQAFAHLHRTMQEFSTQVVKVREETLLLRLAPLSTLLPTLRQAITAIPGIQGQRVELTVTGEYTEIDESYFVSLTNALHRFIQNCTTNTMPGELYDDRTNEPLIWLHIQGNMNDLAIEVGFAMAIQGGALDVLRDDIQHMRGTITLERNKNGGVSFYLRIPHSRSMSRYLLLRVANEQFIVPFAQIWRISEVERERIDILYQIHDLLSCPIKNTSPMRVRPVLLLPPNSSHRVIGIEVDEIIDEADLIVKPLSAILQRPGIAGAAIDGSGRVLLQIDIPELISQYLSVRPDIRERTRRSPTYSAPYPVQPKILIADDSVYLRHSLSQILQHASYTVVEARDGMEALEQLFQEAPDILLLDVEMPNLNGYDLLRVMVMHPELANVKVIMLSTRSSQKHIQRALDLGARAYLTKPYSQDTLLAKIEELLDQ
jgi:chemosensory pili system protein ChpA (sensor histidine kinase/response regulator)